MLTSKALAIEPSTKLRPTSHLSKYGRAAALRPGFESFAAGIIILSPAKKPSYKFMEGVEVRCPTLHRFGYCCSDIEFNGYIMGIRDIRTFRRAWNDS